VSARGELHDNDRARKRAKTFARIRVDAPVVTTSKKCRRNKDFLHAHDVCISARGQIFSRVRTKNFHLRVCQSRHSTPKIFFTGRRFWKVTER
jgi:hypothetical protein